jgi:hypothetical protein
LLYYYTIIFQEEELIEAACAGDVELVTACFEKGTTIDAVRLEMRD